jgi:SNF2 family DNA or RNA helicase
LILYPPSTTIEKVVVDNDSKEHLNSDEKEIMRNCLGVKFDYLLDFCNQAKEQSVVIFSTRSDTFLVPLSKKFEERGLKVGLIVGATSMKERQRLVEAFQNKEIDILCCNVISAGVGLNLSQADIVIFADRAWSPADNEQAEDRFLPVYEKDVKPKIVIDLVCQKTIDEKVIELLKKKQDITKLVLDNPSILF